MWPLMVAAEMGGCLCSHWSVSPANSGRCPHLSASASMDAAGLKSAVWANATKVAGLAVLMAACAVCGVLFWRSNSHRPTPGFHCPCSIMLPCWCWMMMSWAVNATSHPALHSWPMESSGCIARCGTMWPCRAARGRAGRLSSASCIDFRRAPDGVWMVIGCMVGHTLHMGVSMVKKCAVHLVSAMARNGVLVRVGGPVLVTVPTGEVVFLTCGTSLVFCGVFSGFPHPHF